MAKRGSTKKPLEWMFGFVNTTDATVTNYRIELGLKDDEVAEIHKVESLINFANIPDAANDEVQGDLAISMDPDVIADPSTAANNDDLELFFHDRSNIQIEAGAAGTSVIEKARKHVTDHKQPVLVGTDVGMVVKGDASIACEFWVRIFFTRRRATVMELNQVLLKRR